MCAYACFLYACVRHVIWYVGKDIMLRTEELQEQIRELEQAAFLDHVEVQNDEEDIADDEWEVPDWCVPIKANVMNFEFDVRSHVKKKKSAREKKEEEEEKILEQDVQTQSP